MKSTAEDLADKFAAQVSTEGRVLNDMFIGRECYNTVTSIVRAAFLAGARVQTDEVFADVQRERERQEELKAAGRFKYTCADVEMNTGGKIATLGEEFGEVCKAALERDGLSNDISSANPLTDEALRKELVQVAAVAVAWIECLDAVRTPVTK